MTRVALSQCLIAEGGQMRLDIPDGLLPSFLIEAFNAAQVPDLARAQCLLSDANLARARSLADGGADGADVIRLVTAMTLQRMGWLKRALEWYQQIAEPHALVLNEMAVVYKHLGRVSQASQCQQEAMLLAPEDPGLWVNLGVDLMLTGRCEEGLELMRQAVDRCPENGRLHSAMLSMMPYAPGMDRRTLFEEHCRWGRRHTPVSRARTHHDHDADPDRRLRVGYLSPDLHDHSVTYTFEPLLDGHDHGEFEIHGYGNVARPDDVTLRLCGKFDQYHNIHGLDDRAVVAQIDRDRIDILVTMAGHTGGNRLTVLGYKPAPLLMDMGSLATLGIQQVDVRLTDPILDPAEDQQYYLEDLEYIPGGVISYRPPDWAPPVGPLPALRNGFVTFGSFNCPQKIPPMLVSLWSVVLRSVQGSRLLMKYSGGDDPSLAEHFLELFEKEGIGRDRIRTVGWLASKEHLDPYHQVDIALDTYPFNGCITTLEGLWMGVPVVTLAGTPYMSRAGWTILHHLGLDPLVAHSADEYAAKTEALAGNLDGLSRIRGALRDRMTASPLCDARRFAREVEAVYRRRWRQWCQTQKSEDRSQKTEEGRRTGANAIA